MYPINTHSLPQSPAQEMEKSDGALNKAVFSGQEGEDLSAFMEFPVTERSPTLATRQFTNLAAPNHQCNSDMSEKFLQEVCRLQ